MRMFTALVPPPTVLGEIEDFVAPRRGTDPAVRFVDVDSWHVTTAFAESVSHRRVDRLVEGLTEMASRTAPIDVTLGGAGCFPNPAQAKVLYLVAEPAEPLGHLASACRQTASHAGIEVDGARFHPHLTLARMRRPVEATKWLQVLQACPPASWHATELLLIESHLRDLTNRYEVVERFRLTG
jgi:RNA 2',3'-cyclic 3'-phosphodiesterase